MKLTPYRESWILRAMLIALVVLAASYVASMISTVQSINSVSNISYDPDVSNALSSQLRTIKELYTLNQKLYLEKLNDLLAQEKLDARKLDAEQTKIILRRLAMDDFLDSQTVNIVSASSSAAVPVWINPQSLHLGHHEIQFNSGKLYEDFKNVEAVRQRYEFIGAALEKQIKPSLITINSIILASSFLIILAVFIVLMQRFKSAIARMLDGFRAWSFENRAFRFDTAWRGELRLITDQFNKMADAVEANRRRSMYLEKVASWQIMARKLAHEIKNPLTPIQMMVSQLRRRYQGDDAEFAELLKNAQEIITEEITALKRMVDHFSEFARLPVPTFKRINIVELLQRTASLQQSAYEAHHIEVDSTAEALEIQADPDLLRQVLINLIKNAVEAAGDKKLTIRLGLKDLGSEVEITVQDNGAGIPADIQANIFEAYFTTKHSGPTPGMGLGLAIGQKIVIDHHGELSVKSQPGDTRFIIRIPKRQQGETL